MKQKMSMGGHQSTKMISDEWLTPPEILQELGEFDLDPCSPIKRPWPTAKNHYTVLDDGLNKPWAGRVWLNPPYSREAFKWMTKLSEHGNGLALLFARTETKMFFETVWEKADAVKFIKGRLYFHRVDGVRARANAGAPSCLIAYGIKNVKILSQSNIPGKIVYL